MRNCSRLLTVVLIALAGVLPVMANFTLTVYQDSDEPDWIVPVNLLYLDEAGTRSQVIYPAEVLSEMKNEVINSVTFYTYNNIEASGGTVRVSLAETTQGAFGPYVGDLTQVATITITPGVNRLVINFDQPFLYTGKNLVIDTYVEEAGICSGNADLFVCERASSYCSISRGEVSRSIPKATFDYGTDAPYGAKVLPAGLNFNTVRAGREDVQSLTLKNVGSNPFTPSFSVTGPFEVDFSPSALASGASFEVPVKFLPVEAGDYADVLSIDCGEAGVVTVDLYATALAAAQDLTVCDSLAVGTLPIDGVYIDIVGTEGQMIYPAEMLTEMLNSKIVEIKFYPQRMKMNGGTVTLSISTTEQPEYYLEEMFTGLTTVAAVTPVRGSTEFVFTFDQPFEYTGGNLVIDALVTEAGEMNLESSSFFGIATDTHSSLEAWDYYGYYVSFVDFLPKVTFSYQKNEPGFELGDVNHDHSVDVSDVTAMIAYILGSGGNIAFYESEANCDGDAAGRIDVGDVTALINRVLSGQW